MNAIVVLPEHLHTVWTMPADDADSSTRWCLIKSTFSRHLAREERIPPSRLAKASVVSGSDVIDWEHTIRHETDFIRHIDYVHINPVKHGWVKRVVD